MEKADAHYISHLEQAKYMRKPYVLVSAIAKKTLRLQEGVKICIFVPVYYFSFNASRIPDIFVMSVTSTFSLLKVPYNTSGTFFSVGLLLSTCLESLV